MKGLGRRAPQDWTHVDKYGLTAATVPGPPTPIAIGINWYSNFDNPTEKWSGIRKEYWIGQGDLGSIRGGHCVCVKPSTLSDRLTWYWFYDQGHEGACVGFGSSRMMTLLNRKRYFARWLWDIAKLNDGWDDTNPGDDNGTSVRAAMDVLRTQGHIKWQASYDLIDNFKDRDKLQPVPDEGISANRWATSVDEMRAVLSSPSNDKRQAFQILNSWGRDYPHSVWIPYETMQRLLDEDGEAALVTDK